jgi:phospholipid/cholesterol/gamma-HCH transport system substrate-binding protein
MRNSVLAAKVIALCVAFSLMATIIVLIFGTIRIEDSNAYNAVFSDVSGLKEGDDVRAVGVAVGRVQRVQRLPDNTIKVEFTLESQVHLTADAQGVIRYKNLVGDRFMEVDQGQAGQLLSAGGTIPVSQTRPALDLDALYNGFTPLFEGLNPQQINQLSASLIATLQGQGGAVGQLLSDVGSFTTSLADRDALIGQLITNLNTVAGAVNARAPELSQLVDQLQRVVSLYAAQRGPIGESLAHINDLTASVESVLRPIRPDIKAAIPQLQKLSQTFAENRDRITSDMRLTNGAQLVEGRLGIYGAHFQFYLCGIQLRIKVPEGPPLKVGGPPTPPQDILTPWIGSGETRRCQYN